MAQAQKHAGADWNVLAPYFSPYFSLPVRRAAKPKKPDYLVEMQRVSKAAMAKARRLAKKIGVEIEFDSDGAYWVTHPKFDNDPENDPLEGMHFAVGGDEVLQAVKAYEDFFKASEGESK